MSILCRFLFSTKLYLAMYILQRLTILYIVGATTPVPTNLGAMEPGIFFGAIRRGLSNALTGLFPIRGRRLREGNNVGETVVDRATVNQADRYGFTPLHHAVHDQDLPSVASLIANGADVNLPCGMGFSVLHRTAQRGSVEMATLLIANGADVNQIDSDGVTPLQFAARRGSSEMANFFIVHGANVNQGDSDGRTPLHTGAQRGHVDVVRLLIQNGANVNQEDSNGRSALDRAGENREVVDLLIANGATDIDPLVSIFNRYMRLSFRDISRERPFFDSIPVIARATAESLNGGVSHVSFLGESGVGKGVIRDWFSSIAEDIRTHVSLESAPSDQLEVIGRFIALSIAERVPIYLGFPELYYKKLLGRALDLSDVEAYDKILYNSLSFLLTLKTDSALEDYPLTINGEEKTLTLTNRIDLILQKINSLVPRAALNGIGNGITFVFPLSHLQARFVDGQRFKAGVEGEPVVNVAHLISNMSFTGSASEWMVDILRSFDQSMLRRFVQYAGLSFTGSRNGIPTEKKITIRMVPGEIDQPLRRRASIDDSSTLSISNTYTSRRDLERLMRQAIQSTVEVSDRSTYVEASELIKNIAFTGSSAVWFREVIESYDQPMLRQFLRFVTSNSQVPMGGFASARIQVAMVQDQVDKLPRAATCFNTLYLSNTYSSREELERLMAIGIQESQGLEDAAASAANSTNDR